MVRQSASVISQLPPLVLQALRLADLLTQGPHGKKQAGLGDEFLAYRSYTAGESAGAIDWRASARTAHPVVRETEKHLPHSVYLWVDNSPSMQYRSQEKFMTKAEAAQLIGLGLGAMLYKGSEQVGTLDGQVKPNNNASSLSRLYEVFQQKTQLSLPTLNAKVGRAHVVLIGDLLPQAAETDQWLKKHLDQGVTLSMIEVCDVAEDTFRFERPTRFKGLEQEGELKVLAPQDLRQQYLARRAQFRSMLQDLCQRSGGHYFIYRTDTDLEELLLELHQHLAQQPAR